ncbi:MAG: UDP-N-acetylmuramoyl-L-alanyl-D-glutamate--2,6-diaminopimelate ligase [Bacteroidetes bacterium]|nr:MAG: UDP-N-acetylmuramoyl-L-alanyl-D-glutamate--2,6-diaminopimelate ligase [Bacteroidota bacterium]
MEKLTNILEDVNVEMTVGEGTVDIRQITFDSRDVGESDLFVALKGATTDGHLFIQKAIRQGARAIVCETLPAELTPGVVFIKVPDSHLALGQMAANFYGHPSANLKLVGITGTNGKTTTATLLYELFTNLGYKVGLISTIENKIGRQPVPATHTTPDALSTNLLIRDMVESGCDFAFMEVSSHAIHQKRIAGLQFAGGVFTNITHDHLDYHKTFKAYLEAKKMFFDNLPETAFALINADDKNGRIMVQNTRAKVYRYALRKPAEFKAKILENLLSGLHLILDDTDFYARLTGRFNALNLLAAYGTAILLEQDKLEVFTALSALRPAEGRFEVLTSPDQSKTAIVDYAHTPDALEKVLQTIDELKEGHAKVITVVGCGGDRDRGKRPKMAKIACDYSDQVFLTSDNPRSEDPEAILEEMKTGIPAYASQKVIAIANRREAIRAACMTAPPGAIILVAGKGHEKYQEIKGIRHHFDDKEILREALK